MEAKDPVRPAWPPVRIISAGLGFALPVPRDAWAIRPAQRTLVVDGASVATRTVTSR